MDPFLYDVPDVKAQIKKHFGSDNKALVTYEIIRWLFKMPTPQFVKAAEHHRHQVIGFPVRLTIRVGATGRREGWWWGPGACGRVVHGVWVVLSPFFLCPRGPFSSSIWGGMRLYLVVAVVVGFSEDRMMDIITSRAPPSARAESHLSFFRSKGFVAALIAWCR